MVNGVLYILAAVFFAVVSLRDGINLIWLAIAGFYLAAGLVNLLIHTVKVKKKKTSAKKAGENPKQKPGSGADAAESVTGG